MKRFQLRTSESARSFRHLLAKDTESRRRVSTASQCAGSPFPIRATRFSSDCEAAARVNRSTSCRADDRARHARLNEVFSQARLTAAQSRTNGASPYVLRWAYRGYLRRWDRCLESCRTTSHRAALL